MAEVVNIEAKLYEADFENVWHQLSNMEWYELKKACEFAYIKGRVAGKSEGMRLAIDTLNKSDVIGSGE